jgi:pilus assembly protein CpaF
MSWETIIPFLRPIESLIVDPEISDIMVNRSARVFVEKDGQVQEVPGVSIGEKFLQVGVRNIARSLGSEISEEKPILDARLPDGSRIAAIFPPCSVEGTTLAIRKFHSKLYTADELVRIGSLPSELLQQLQLSIEQQESILISGGTGTGKTTLLAALTAFIPPEDRVVVIEDTSEIQIERNNLVRLEARKEQPYMPAVTIGDLLKATLRLRPDRILLGEVRDGAAFDLLQAMNTGHQGTLSTIHANSAPKSLTRFATCVMMAGIELPHRTVCANIAEALDILVHIERRKGKRIVTQVLRVEGYDSALDRYQLEPIYQIGS